MLTATFEEPPSVPTQLRVGDYVVSVTNAGFYAFLLEKGVDYYFDTYPRASDVIGFCFEHGVTNLTELAVSILADPESPCADPEALLFLNAAQPLPEVEALRGL